MEPQGPSCLGALGRCLVCLSLRPALPLIYRNAPDGILYHLEKDKTLTVVVRTDSRKELFSDVHSEFFWAHLRTAKIHSQLA